MGVQLYRLLPGDIVPTAKAAHGKGALPAELAILTWQSGIGELVQTRCAACHGSTAKLGGLDLSSLQAAMSGGVSGPAVVPGEASTSTLITRQTSGKHPGMFTAEELQLVIHWIESGALDK